MIIRSFRRASAAVMLAAIVGAGSIPVAAQDQPVTVDVIRFGSAGRPVSMDPLQAAGITTYQVMILATGQLYRLNADGIAVPDLVAETTVADDGLTYTMRLHEGITFSDGRPLTSTDVVASFERVREAPQTNQVLIRNVTGVEVADPLTIVWTLSAPQVHFPSWFAFGFMPVYPADATAEEDFAEPVSAGPFIVRDWIPNSPTTTLVANPAYIHGQSSIAQIQVIHVPDATTRALQLSQGQLDIVQDLPGPALTGLPATVDATASPVGGNYFLLWNADRTDGPLADVNVRRAISLALDRDRIMDLAFQGRARASHGIAFPGTPEADAAAELGLPGGGLQDLEAAAAALAESAYPEGFEVTLQVAGSRPGWQDATLVIQQQLAAIGIIVAVEPLEDAVAFGNLGSGNYDLAFTGAGGYPYIPLMWYVQVVGQGGVLQSWSRCQDDQIDAAIAAAEVASEEDAAGRFLDVERRNSEILCVIPIGERVEVHAQVPDRVRDLFGFARLSQFQFVE